MRERERVRVRMLLSLVAHAVGYKMMIGAHITVCVRRMWEVLPYSPCMANDGARNTVGQIVGAHNTTWVLTWEVCRAPF